MTLGMPTGDRLKHLLARLRDAGVAPSFVRDYVFPRWFTDETARTQSGYAMALGYVSSGFGIPISKLWDANSAIECPDATKTHFKKRAGVADDDLKWARSVGVSISEIAINAIETDYLPLPDTSQELRQELLSKGIPWINLETLLDALWGRGIPVLFLPNVPGHKMEGLAALADDRPVIVLSTKHKFGARSAYDLAHETGHVISKHLLAVPVILDEKIRSGASDDPEEREANAAAFTLLTGYPGPRFLSETSDPVKLAAWAMERGKQIQADPSVLAWIHGNYKGHYGSASDACKVLKDDYDPYRLIRRKMAEHLNLDLVTRTEREFFVRVTGVEEDDVST